MRTKKRRRDSWIAVSTITPTQTPEQTSNHVNNDFKMAALEDPESLKDEDDPRVHKGIYVRSSIRQLVVCIAGSLFLSWFLGACGLSVAWLLLFVAVVVAKCNATLSLFVDEARWGEERRVRRKQALTGLETAEWLNILFNRWWLCSADSLFRVVRERFEPILNESKPSFVEKVEILQFSLGEQTPCVQSIRTYDVSLGTRRPVLEKSLVRSLKHQVAVEVGVHLNSEEFRMILRARLFGKGMGMDLDLAIEKLYISGKLGVFLTLDMNSPFPHVTSVSLTFLEKPDVWFSVKVLKSVQMMEVPIIKTWLHSVVVDALESAIVDPGTITFSPGLGKPDVPTPDDDNGKELAQGVLIVTLAATTDNTVDSDLKWMVLKLGSQSWRTKPITSGWKETPCFLVESLQTDKLALKLKSKRLVSTVTVAQYEMCLDEYNLEYTQEVETQLQKKNPRLNQIPSIILRLEYAPLPPVCFEQPPVLTSNAVSGVLTILIQSAQGLPFSDNFQCNPYCIVFSNRKKVKSTPYVVNCVTPQWQARCQLLVTDYTTVSLSFVVCSWNTKKMTDDEMLGVGVLNLTSGDVSIMNKSIPLSGSPNALLTASVVFQPVAKMTGEVGDGPQPRSDTLDTTAKVKRNSSSWVQQAKCFLGRGDQEIQSGTDISNILASGLGLMEITLLRARELLAMDANGFSDPYCEFKVNGDCKYKSSVKKKTLNPQWEENAILAMPRNGETLDVLVWDHDSFGKDFLGSVTFALDAIRLASSKDICMWYPLQGVRSGELELKIKIISDDPNVYASSGNPSSGRESMEASPVPRRASMDRSRIRLGMHVPPPIPPRTISIPQKTQHKAAEIVNGDTECAHLEPCLPRLTVTDSPLLTRPTSRASSLLTVESAPPSPVEESEKDKRETDVNSFRSMRLKVTRSLRLRRFKSEANVRGPNGRANGALGYSPSELLNHAVSQPDVNKTPPARPTELNLKSCSRPDTFSGIEGRVIQAHGLHVAHVAQLYCRVKYLGEITGREKPNTGKTLAKTHLLPAVPNPQFELDFQISNPETVPRQGALQFEIRSCNKELVALRRITLQDILSGDLKETHTWLALNNGATLEVSIAHGRILKKQSKKLFRSWSVHRIGKV